MGGPGIDVQFGRYASLVEALGVVDALVAQTIEGAHYYVAWRQSEEVGCPACRGIGRDLIGSVQAAEVAHPGEGVRIGVPDRNGPLTGRGDLPIIEQGVEEELKAHWHFAPVASNQAQPG